MAVCKTHPALCTKLQDSFLSYSISSTQANACLALSHPHAHLPLSITPHLSPSSPHFSLSPISLSFPPQSVLRLTPSQCFASSPPSVTSPSGMSAGAACSSGLGWSEVLLPHPPTPVSLGGAMDTASKVHNTCTYTPLCMHPSKSTAEGESSSQMQL